MPRTAPGNALATAATAFTAANAMPSTTRRRLVAAFALAASLQSVPARVFSESVRRIGFLADWKAPSPQSPVWLRDRLKALGFEEGRNLVIERGYTTSENLDATARELVARGVEVIVAHSNAAAEAAFKATRTIPIVVVFGIDPLRAGLVQSLSRPGGNVTGNAFYSFETVTKTLEVVLEAFPKARRVGILRYKIDRRRRYDLLGDAYTAKERQLAAERHIAFPRFEFNVDRNEESRDRLFREVRDALSRIKAASLDVLQVQMGGDFPFGDDVLQEIANFATGARIPTIGIIPYWVDQGGLFYFGPDHDESYERTPRYVTQLLRGAKAAELPMEQPSTYLLWINMKTARALGYAVPNTLRIRADRIVE